MKSKVLLSTLLILIFLAQSPKAQLIEQSSVKANNPAAIYGVAPAKSAFSLIDLSKVHWSNSYSVAFFSGGSTSGSLGLLNSMMVYDISSKLTMAVNIGVAHNTGAIWGDGNSEAKILPGFQLDYRPSEKFRMSLLFQTYNGAVTPYGLNNNSYYNPWRTRWLRGDSD